MNSSKYSKYSKYHFLSKRDSYSVIRNNEGYYETFTPLDLKARGIQNVKDYFPIIRESIDQFTPEEKEILVEWMKKADDRLSSIYIEGFDGKKASRLKWKIICMKGQQYENGFPHTVDDIIVLYKEMIDGMNEKDWISSLMHEKVHVYQRKYKNDVKRYLRANRFDVLRNYDSSRRRANPDINPHVYRKGNRIYETRYRTRDPSDIHDCVNKKYEHPYEEMAYKIEKM